MDPEEMSAADMRAKAQRLLAAADDVDGRKQYSQSDLKAMSPQQIVDARHKGQLDDLLSGGAA